VSRPEEFQWRKDTIGTIEHPAAREGQVLYAREYGSDDNAEYNPMVGSSAPKSREIGQNA
jgi:hypothetical protein